MKKILSTALLLITLGLGVVANTSTAEASSWHNGLPKSLQYTKWRRGADKITFGKKGFSFWGPVGGQRFGIPQMRVKYKVLAPHRYALSHFEAHMSFQRTVSYVTKKSRTKLYWRASKTARTLVYHRY